MPWICSECGIENTDDSMNWCFCGAEYQAQQSVLESKTDDSHRRNPKLVYIATFVVAVTSALVFWTWDWRFLILGIPAAIYAHKNKPVSGNERNKLEHYSNKTFAYSLIFPVGIIFFLLISVAIYAIFKKNFL